MKVAFLGLGVMGGEMASHVLSKGYQLSVYNRSPEKLERFKGTKARIATSYADCAEGADLVLTCLGDGASVKEVLFGEGGVVEALSAGAIVADHSTISPTEAEEIAIELAKKKIPFLDAPVTGGDIGAKNGTLTMFIGGSEEILDLVRPVLSSFSTKIVYVGPNGFGQKMKAVNQIGAIGSMTVLGEMLAFGSELGLDINDCVEALKDGAAGSFALNRMGPRIAQGDFRPGFSVKHSLKDMKIVLAEAEKLELPLRVTPVVAKALEKLTELGSGEEGNHSVFRIVKERK